jgi:hypothetical protein
MRKDLFAIAEQSGVVGVQSQTSGVAMAYDFQAHESVLKQTASMAVTLEQKIAELFMKYTTESFIYTVTYPSDFAPAGMNSEVDRLKKVIEIPGINSVFRQRLEAKLARIVLKDEDQSVVDEVTKNILEIPVTTIPSTGGKPNVQEAQVGDNSSGGSSVNTN